MPVVYNIMQRLSPRSDMRVARRFDFKQARKLVEALNDRALKHGRTVPPFYVRKLKDWTRQNTAAN